MYYLYREFLCVDLSEDGKEVGTADPFLKKEENSSARQRTRILLRKTSRRNGNVEIRISVRSLVEFILRSGSIDTVSYTHLPIVHTYHTVYEDYTHYFSAGRPWGKQAAAWFSRFILEKTDFVIAPTQKVKGILNSYGVDRPVAVIPTGIRPVSYTHLCGYAGGGRF